MVREAVNKSPVPINESLRVYEVRRKGESRRFCNKDRILWKERDQKKTN